MKFLLIFVDMLRPALLNVYDERNKENRIDRQLREWGGTVYTRCYTPAPDTPRSLGCLWTSRYPKDNGCDNRLKYPYFFQKKECVDLLSILKKAGYQFNFYMPESSRKIGGLPLAGMEGANYSGDVTLEEYLKTLVIEENSFTYFYLADFHKIVDNYFSQRKYIELGYEKIGKELEMIQQYLDIDTFDLTFLFSDHGMKFRDEVVCWNDHYDLQLNNDRIQITMITHQKNEKKIQYNNKLSTIMDIYPTICDYAHINIQHEIEGIDLFREEEYPYVFIEDHKTFNVELGQAIELWAIINEKGCACVNCDKQWVADYAITDEEKQRYENILSDRASGFTENTKMRSIQNYYNEDLIFCKQYADGEKMVPHKLLKDILLGFVSQVYRKLKLLILRILS